MLTKGIIQSVNDKYTYRVRIPVLDKAEDADGSTPNDELPTAAICTTPGVDMNLREGDVVYVMFEDYSADLPVILGKLYYSNDKSITLPDIKAQSLTVETNAVLPENTQIGSVDGTTLQYLRGVSDFVQDQINTLSDNITKYADYFDLLNPNCCNYTVKSYVSGSTETFDVVWSVLTVASLCIMQATIDLSNVTVETYGGNGFKNPLTLPLALNGTQPATYTLNFDSSYRHTIEQKTKVYPSEIDIDAKCKDASGSLVQVSRLNLQIIGTLAG